MRFQSSIANSVNQKADKTKRQVKPGRDIRKVLNVGRDVMSYDYRELGLSLQKRPVDLMDQSSGIISAADKKITSPGTTVSTCNSCFLPSLNTAQCSCTNFSSSFTTLAAPRSCQKPSRLYIYTTARMITVSAKSPRHAESNAATISIMVTGLLNCDKPTIRMVCQHCP